jgi:hypothetical protein
MGENRDEIVASQLVHERLPDALACFEEHARRLRRFELTPDEVAILWRQCLQNGRQVRRMTPAEPALELDEVLPPLYVLEQLASISGRLVARERRQHTVPIEQLADFFQTLADTIVRISHHHVRLHKRLNMTIPRPCVNVMNVG